VIKGPKQGLPRCYSKAGGTPTRSGCCLSCIIKGLELFISLIVKGVGKAKEVGGKVGSWNPLKAN
jgi:hypothetical protein